jgi:hypothetical protein
VEGRGTSNRRTIGGKHGGCNGTQGRVHETAMDSD